MSLRKMIEELKETATSINAGYAINATALGVGTWIEIHFVQIIAVFGLIITSYYNHRQNKRDCIRLIMEKEEHEALLHSGKEVEEDGSDSIS